MGLNTAPTFSVLITGGTIVDGTGGPAYRADVGLQGDAIAAVGDLGSATADTTVDAAGLTVTPGFIDVHVHSELALLAGHDTLVGARQGITTNLLAPDGFGWAPLDSPRCEELFAYTATLYGGSQIEARWPTIDSYLDRFAGATPLNVFPQVPHCAVRLRAMGWDARHATPDELQAMEEGTREWMDAGAGALCLGLDYQPSANASFDELVRLCQVTAEQGGIYAAHQRYSHLGRPVAWRETIELAKASCCPVHVSHERVDEDSGAALEQVEREKVDLSFESYLYPAGMTHLEMALPIHLHPGGWPAMAERLRRPGVRDLAVEWLAKYLGRGDQIVGYSRSGRHVGERTADLAAAAGKSIGEFAFDLVMEEEGAATMVFPWQTPVEEHERVIAATAVHPRMMVASDGVYDVPHPHPRSFGCFARVLGEFVRDRGLLSLPEAVYKMAGFPAERFRVPDRGVIRAGAAADLAVFDAETVAARSTWEEPRQEAVGMRWVLVNGRPIIADGAPTGSLPGRVLARK